MAAPAKKKKETPETAGTAAPSRAANANGGAAGKKTSRRVILIAVLAAVGAAFAFTAANVGGLAKRGIENRATLALGVPVKIAGLDISLQNKEIAVTGIEVFNPQGYSDAVAVGIGTAKIAADSIGQQVLVFNQINVDATKILFETTEQGSNMTQLRRQAKAGQEGAAPAADDVKVIIKELIISNATLQPAGLAAGVSAEPLTLPDIRIAGIGVKENGVSVPVAMAHITDALTVVSVKAALERNLLTGITPENLQIIQQDLGIPASLMDQVRGIGDKVKSLFEP